MVEGNNKWNENINLFFNDMDIHIYLWKFLPILKNYITKQNLLKNRRWKIPIQKRIFFYWRYTIKISAL